MSVKLISYTKPIEELELPFETIEEHVAFIARVSNPVSQASNLRSERLINYLVKNKHWSPFEMIDITLEIITTRDIGRQILRHRSFSFQEFSQRYAITETPNTIREARMQDPINRQSSIISCDDELIDEWTLKQTQIINLSTEIYHWALEKGIAKEQARVILPEGLTETRMYMKGSLRSWMHYIDVRADAGVQKEHRDLAILIAQEISKVFPPIMQFV